MLTDQTKWERGGSRLVGAELALFRRSRLSQGAPRILSLRTGLVAAMCGALAIASGAAASGKAAKTTAHAAESIKCVEARNHLRNLIATEAFWERKLREAEQEVQTTTGAEQENAQKKVNTYRSLLKHQIAPDIEKTRERVHFFCHPRPPYPAPG